MKIHDTLRAIGWIAGQFVPQQAIRALVGRDFNAALARVDALMVAEERSEVLEPSDFPLCNCAGRQAADLDDHRPDCAARTHIDPSSTNASAPMGAVVGDGPDGDCSIRREPPSGHSNTPACAARAADSPAGVRIPPTMPPAGHLVPPIAGNTPAAESEAQSSAAGLPDLVELIADVLHDTRGMSANGQAREVAARIERAAPPMRFETGLDIGMTHAAEMFPQHTKK